MIREMPMALEKLRGNVDDTEDKTIKGITVTKYSL